MTQVGPCDVKVDGGQVQKGSIYMGARNNQIHARQLPSTFNYCNSASNEIVRLDESVLHFPATH